MNDAVERRDVHRVRELLATPNDVVDGLTPLIRALQLRSEVLVWLLLDRATLNWFPHCSSSPIATAVEYYPEMVAPLIDKGASVHSCFSPVTAAVKTSNTVMLQYLLSRGASINGGDVSPLHQAVADCNLAMVELVLAEGAFIDLQDSFGATALLSTTNVEVVDLLLTRQANVNLSNLLGITPLISAVGYDAVGVVELLLQHDADVNLTSHSGITPLHMAVYVNNLMCAHMLVSQGADVNAVDIAGVSPLVTAAWVENSDAMVALLLDMNADVNLIAANGVTSLFHAVSNENAAMVSMLLCHGANINHPLPDGTTPLHSAVFLQNSEIVDLLLQFRANPNLPMVDGTTPIQSAVRMPSLYIVERLLAHGSSRALHTAAECGALPCVKLLLRYGEVNALDQHGCSAIKYAIENEHVDVTILLWSEGAYYPIYDITPYREWATHHIADLDAMTTLFISTFFCSDLKRVIFSFLLPANVTALAWRAVGSIA